MAYTITLSTALNQIHSDQTAQSVSINSAISTQGNKINDQEGDEKGTFDSAKQMIFFIKKVSEIVVDLTQ
jgi:hypothetical protein